MKTNAVMELVPGAPVDTHEAEDARVQGDFAGLLPEARCPACKQTLSDSFSVYPTIDVRSLDSALRLKRRRSVSLDQFRDLSRTIQRALRGELKLVPGGQLGPFVGARATTLEYDVERETMGSCLEI